MCQDGLGCILNDYYGSCVYFIVCGIITGSFFEDNMAANKKETVVEEQREGDYELVFIISPEVSEEALEARINGVSQFVANKGGVVSEVEQWGKRRLAYPIGHFLEGHYVETHFKMNPRWSKELEANLHISEDILRHLLVKSGD